LPDAPTSSRSAEHRRNKLVDPDERVIAMLGARSAHGDRVRGNGVATESLALTTNGIFLGVRPRDTSSDSHEAQLRAYRQLGPSGRARVAARLSADTRELARAGIRSRHPEYRDEEVEIALRRLLLGDELFHRAWPALPLLAP
jgi:hypothetical protein